MHIVHISAEAQADIDGIAEYTTSQWGWRQTDIYLAELEDGFDLLARNPSIGRPCDSIQPGLRRFEAGRHVAFYRVEPDGIRIVRVLHQQMIPTKPRFDK
ncbi:MAG: type II toxin-antitoxin system RelE/ParE family toxin [Terracidiphilus sp.]